MNKASGSQLQLLKKSQIIRTLNISSREFERKLADGLIPMPIVWISDNPKGRRWHPDHIRQTFGIELAK
ncbi:protein of unknown function [Candidatus Filomicrobium marinum]|uniref:Uncharacterized protein n=1 Tax=Candidatus Filomicrobium marinum TaxID=1608628 RepID=A0A0D6JFE5_9HYPH|nr:hypothetical protein [Candidatus Filomicrobium marinum]CFX24517.1 protein of unknown function [Candidatus Filomicrobium marinum]CPR19179.1 protein of unknown function [Candidatus Filomicrobium marinum]